MTTDKDATIARLTAELEAARAQIEHQRENKDAAYLERNKLVALLAAIFPAGIKQTAIEGWSNDWHSCVYIDFPWGQASWHYNDSHASLFAHLPPYACEYDGHTTEAKYAGIIEASRQDWSARVQIGAVLQEAVSVGPDLGSPSGREPTLQNLIYQHYLTQMTDKAALDMTGRYILALNPEAMAALERAKAEILTIDSISPLNPEAIAANAKRREQQGMNLTLDPSHVLDWSNKTGFSGHSGGPNVWHSANTPLFGETNIAYRTVVVDYDEVKVWKDKAQKAEAEVAEANAHAERLAEAAFALQSDMLERARTGIDIIRGEKYQIVNAGRTAWSNFCAALVAHEARILALNSEADLAALQEKPHE